MAGSEKVKHDDGGIKEGSDEDNNGDEKRISTSLSEYQKTSPKPKLDISVERVCVSKIRNQSQNLLRYSYS